LVSPGGAVSTLLDSAGVPIALVDPTAVAVGPDGSVYVAQAGANRVTKLALESSTRATATIIAGASDGSAGFLEGPGSTARFSRPQGIAVDADGRVFVADGGNHRVRLLSPAGVSGFNVATAAGLSAGTPDGAATTSDGLNDPAGLAITPQGDLFIADAGNHKIRKLTVGGQLLTVAGTGTAGSTDGNFAAATFERPLAVALRPNGTLLVADAGGNRIRVIRLNL
jgi:DNA-binding beta-propeller fold protein YncE